MKINVTKLSFSVAIAVGLIWAICFFVVWLAPELTSELMAYMLHLNVESMTWQLTMQSFFIGGGIWMLFTLALVWISGAIYNFGSTWER